MVTTGNNADYDKAISNNRFDYLFIQEYNTPPEDQIDFISKSYPLIKQKLPANSPTKIVIGEPTVAVAAGQATIFHPAGGSIQSTKQVTAAMLPQLKQINSDANFGGVMGWSLNVDYDPSDYGDTTNHVLGEFAYGLKDCVLQGQCDTPPTPKPSTSINLDVTNDTPSYGVQVSIIGTHHGEDFVTDWLNTPSGSTPTSPNELVYTTDKNPTDTNVVEAPSLAQILNKKNLRAFWITYAGGPMGECSGSFDFTERTHILVNADEETCKIEHY